MSYPGFPCAPPTDDPMYPTYCQLRLTRLLSKTKQQDDGCLIWQGCCDKAGYGRTAKFLGTVLVHRLVWLLSGNLIPSGEELDHTCHVRNCMNIAHLRSIPHNVNMSARKLDMSRVCHLGHAKKLSPRGAWVCYVCLRQSVKRWQSRNPQQQREIWARGKARIRAQSNKT